jgi:small subunit ribosomal protein S20
MPTHYSALKRTRQTKRRSVVNRMNRGIFRSSLRRIRQALATGSAEQVRPLLSPTLSRIDKAVQKGLIHKNTAARLKSRLMSRIHAVSAASPK